MRKRNHRIQVRMTDEEFKVFDANVKKSGMSYEAYLRHLVSGIKPIERPSKELLEFIKELHLIGNNMNQIAMRLNSTNHIDALQYRKNYEWLEDVISKASKVNPKWL